MSPYKLLVTCSVTAKGIRLASDFRHHSIKQLALFLLHQ